MKRLTTLTLIALLCIISCAVAQKAEVNQLEHSLRWLKEINFPNYLKDPRLQKELVQETETKVKQFINVSEIQLPDEIAYRTIDFFKKPKVKLPKSSSAEYNIGIVSSITQGGTNEKVFWKMQIIIKSKKQKLDFEQEAAHELIPYSNSIRGSQLPWITVQEFQQIYLMLLDECLGLRGKNALPLTVGDPQLMMEKVEALIDVDKTYKLVVAGNMMERSNSIYRITRDDEIVNDFALKSSKKEYSEEESAIGRDIARGIFTSLTNMDVTYTRESQETRLGTIFAPEGEKRKVLLNWLEEVERSTDEEDGVSSRIISPVTGQYYNSDTLAAKFVYYEEYFPIRSSQSDEFLATDYLDARAIYRIVGEYGTLPFEVLYRDFERLILVSTNHEPRVVIPMINENENSRRTKIKMKDDMLNTNTSQNLFQAFNVDPSSAEWFPIYATNQVDEETVTEIGYFIMLLIFAIGQGE